MNDQKLGGGTSGQRERKGEMNRGMRDAIDMERKQNRQYVEMG